METTLASPRVRRLMLDLMEWLTDGPWLAAPETQDWRAESARDFATVALERFRHKVKKDGRGLEATDDKGRHEVRKDAKKLRYASEFFVGVFEAKRERRRYKRFITALESLQDQLGALNDLVSAPEVIRKHGFHDDTEAETLMGGGKRKSLITAAAEAHEALVDAKRFWR
jgi:CHAD domain-containing protein